MNISAVILIVAGLILATLPMLGERNLLGIPMLKQPKAPWLRIVEFLVAYLIWIMLGRFLEAQAGQIAKQGWQFYAVTLLLFVVAAFPGFTWRYLWRRA